MHCLRVRVTSSKKTGSSLNFQAPTALSNIFSLSIAQFNTCSATSPKSQRVATASRGATNMLASPSGFTTKYGPWAVVTGASSGIGAEFARQLAAAGLSVVLAARREERLQELARSLRKTCSVDAVVVPVDLTTSNGVQRLIAACDELEVGLLVNNAGCELHGSFFLDDVDAHEALLALNVTAVTVLAHSFGRRFCDQGRGGILFLSSISAGGMPWFATYSSSKTYVRSLALTLRDEFSQSGVEVMSLEPGLVCSEMTLNEEMTKESYGPFIMETDVCVSDALNVFGSRAIYTPGLQNRLSKAFVYMLPRTVAISLFSPIYRRLLNPDRFKY